VVVYNALNLVAPAGLRIPVPNVLAVLTGAATLVPVVVGKVVYVPVGGYMAVRAVQSEPAALWFPVVFLVVSLLVLDLFPITVVRPLLAGQSTHQGLMMFAYILGGLTFGWYGIFFGPFLLIAAIHLVRVSFWELLRGEEITPEVSTAYGLGSMPDDGPADRSSDGSAARGDEGDG
jgi:predicted PurR-regulated permease PerM